MFALFITAALSSHPQPIKPVARDWPGGAWTGEDADKGKVFPKGAFPYIPVKEWDAYQRSMSTWLGSQPAKVKNLYVQQSHLKYELFDLPATLAKLDTTLEADTPRLTGTAPLVTCGGTGTVAVEYAYPGRRTIKVVLNGLDFTKMGDSIDLPRPPIRIVGKVGLVEGTITGDQGRFVGTDIAVTDGIVRRMDLSVDFTTGRWEARADTKYGAQRYTGKMRVAK